MGGVHHWRKGVAMDVNVSLKVPALEKLIDYAASGIGSVAGPLLARWHAPRIAEANRIAAEGAGERLQIEAEAQSKAREFLLSRDINIIGELDIAETTRQRIQFQEEKRQRNIELVVRKAADELGDKEVEHSEPDHDWTARFFDCIKDVSSEDMQRLWAKVLSGEVESPGRTSLHTLDILRNLTQDDAKMFSSVADYAIQDFIPSDPKDGKGDSYLDYGVLLCLKECGLLDLGPHLRKLDFALIDTKATIILQHRTSILRIFRTEGNAPGISIPCIRITRAGMELLPVTEHTFQIEYLRAFARFLNTNHCCLAYAPIIQELPESQARIGDYVSL